MTADLAAWFDESVAAFHFRHRIRWTPAQKRKAIELILRANPHRSDRSVTVQTGFSRELVTDVRRRLPDAGYRTGLDGKRYQRIRRSEPHPNWGASPAKTTAPLP